MATSYSRASSYVHCGEQYRLIRVEKVEEQPMVAGIGGKIIHRATETVDHDLFTTGTVSDNWREAAVAETQLELAALKGTRYENPDSWKIFGKQDLAWFIREGIPNAVESYIDWRMEGDWGIYTMPDGSPAIEVPFEFTLASGLEVKGYVDRVFYSTHTGAPLIVDLKSGLKPKTDLQLALYKFGLESLVPGSAFDWGVYYYGMKKGGTMTKFIDLSYWDEGMLSRIYDGADAAVQNQIYIPNPGENCFTCTVSEHCVFSRASI